MKTILYGRKHGKENFEMIAGPNMTTSDQIILREDIAKALPVNDTWAEVHLIHADGSEVKGRLKFITAKQAEESAVTSAKADADLSNSRDVAEKRQKDRWDLAKAEQKKKHEDEVAGLNKLHDAARETISPTSPRAKRVLEERARVAREEQVVEIELEELKGKTEQELRELIGKIPDKNGQQITQPTDNVTRADLIKIIMDNGAAQEAKTTGFLAKILGSDPQMTQIYAD